MMFRTTVPSTSVSRKLRDHLLGRQVRVVDMSRLMLTRKKSRAPQLGTDNRFARTERDVAGQVFVFCA